MKSNKTYTAYYYDEEDTLQDTSAEFDKKSEAISAAEEHLQVHADRTAVVQVIQPVTYLSVTTKIIRENAK